VDAVLGILASLTLSSVVVLAIFAGFCVLLMVPKLRASGRHSRVVRNLDEAVGSTTPYLPANTPRGPIDQLRTPELLQKQTRP
jgi:hypothetical protein